MNILVPFCLPIISELEFLLFHILDRILSSQCSGFWFFNVCSVQFSSVQLLSRVWLFATLSRESQHAGPPFLSSILEFTQTHVHRVSDANQPSHPLSSPSPPTPNPSQHQRLFQWVNSSHEVAKVLEFQIQHHPSKEIPVLISYRMDWLDLLARKGLSRVFSNTTVQKHQFFSAQPSSQSNSHIHTWPQVKP